MASVTIEFGTGFLLGFLLSSAILLLAIFFIIRRLYVHLQSRDLEADKKVIVDTIATGIGDVLDHPAVVGALSRSISVGINQWITNPDSQEAVRQAYAKAPRIETAREIGKDLPGYVKHFGIGVVDGLGFRGSTKNRGSVNSESLDEAISSGSMRQKDD